MMRSSLRLLLVALLCASALPHDAVALDCPHCANGSDYNPDLGANGTFPNKVCDACHTAHTGYALGAATVNALCENCHKPGGPGTDVKTHAWKANTELETFCAFCRLPEKALTCSDCHDPHAHKQTTYQLAGSEIESPDRADHFLRDKVRVTQPVSCVEECPAGQFNDPSGQGSCASNLCSSITCSQGTCSVIQDEPVCSCPPTLKPSGGDLCGQCADGYSGSAPTCTPDVGPTVCTGPGASCAAGRGSCAAGGSTCSTECSGGLFNDPSQNGSCQTSSCGSITCTHGTCSLLQSEPVCACDPTLAPSGSDFCGQCAPGYTGTPPNCTPDTGPTVCTGLGASCAGGRGICAVGATCATECGAGLFNDPSQQGSCQSNLCSSITCVSPCACTVTQGEPVCECPPNYDPDGTCATGYTGAGCAADASTCPTSCANGRGVCGSGSPGTWDLIPTANAVVGTVNNPTYAYADGAPGTADLSWNNASLTLSGFSSTNQGTISSVYVCFQSSRSVSGNDSYEFAYNAGTWAAYYTSAANEGETEHCSANLGPSGSGLVATWSQVGALQIRARTIKSGGADGDFLHVDWGYVKVTTSGGATCDCSGTTGYSSCTACAAGYVGRDGACVASCTLGDPCTGSGPGGGSGTCYVDSVGSKVCNCTGRYYGTSCDQCDVIPTYSCDCSSSTRYTSDCLSCKVGYVSRNGACVADCSTADPAPADPCTGSGAGGGAGTCYVDSGGGKVCNCTGKYSGTDCAACAVPAAISFDLIAVTGSQADFVQASGTPGLCQVCHTQTTHYKKDLTGAAHPDYTVAPPGSTPPTSCTSCHQHKEVGHRSGYGFVPDEDSRTCADCHLAAASASASSDVDSYAWEGARAMIDREEWTASGHGRASSYPTPAMPQVGGAPGTVNPAADFHARSQNGCPYCHDKAIGHDTPGNYFRLANSGWNGKGANGTCLVCHSSSDPGYDPDGGGGSEFTGIDGTKDVDNGTDAAYHKGGKHSPDSPNGHNGGQLCWDCHDPHGDTAGTDTTGVAYNYYMIQRRPTEHSDADNLPDTVTAQAKKVDFRPGNDGTAASWSYADLRRPYVADAAGLCRSCHHSSTGAVTYHRKDDASESMHPETVPSGLNPASGETCTTQCHPHPKGFQTQAVGGGTCKGCHLQAPGVSDVVNYSENDTKAMVSADEWLESGHGRLSGTYLSGRSAAVFDNQKDSGCEYCHVFGGHPYSSGNWLQLANRACGSPGPTAGRCGGIASGVVCSTNNDCLNAPCLTCHMTGSPGFDPDGAATDFAARNRGVPGPTASAAIDRNHYGAAHGTSGDNHPGGKFCWDCHDPHGDRGTSGGATWSMMQKAPFEAHDTTAGKEDRPVLFAADIDFAKETGGSPTALDAGDYYSLCSNCHDASVVGKCNKTTGDGDCSGHVAATGTRCTGCHDHNKNPGFGPSHDCRFCHDNDIRGTRRATLADFSKNSHHVGAGSAYMGGTLTNRDCITCHMEGWRRVGSLEPLEVEANGTFHANAKIDLRNVDNTSNQGNGSGLTEGTHYWAYDQSSLPAGADKPRKWNSADASWSAQMETKVDPFCLSCHDANGANAVSTSWVNDSGATAGNPFADTSITNEYDRQSRGSVVDIKSKVSLINGNVDEDGDGSYDPPDGIFSRHAIKGQAPSRYATSNANFGHSAYWNQSTTSYPVGFWNETKQMGCADCHTTDGANATTGNAHGANTEYLLKDRNGDAALGDATNGDTTELNFNCYLCHNPSFFTSGKSLHTPNGSDWADTTVATGTTRVTSNDGNIYGYTCGNCHGGGGVDTRTGVAKFGTIHGTSQVYRITTGGTCTTAEMNNCSNCTGGVCNGICASPETTTSCPGDCKCRRTYRFTNGNSMRFYDPAGWTTSTAGGCWTLATSDTYWGGCLQHDGGAGSMTKNTAAGAPGAAGVRPLAY